MSTVLVLGSGVAGLSCALTAAAEGAEVLLVTPGRLDATEGAAAALAGGNTALAQGGIAAALGAGDDWRSHAADTVSVGAGLVDATAASQLTRQGAEAVQGLIAEGFAADREEDGVLSLGLEAGHGRARIVHAGEDRTGAALHAFLCSQLRERSQTGIIRVIEGNTAASLLGDSGAVTGALLRDAGGALSAVRADAVVVATGGYGALYPQSSNHAGARGEGIVLAARAGALVADLEFVQFHPTVLAGTGSLISEAVRGAGAVLRDGSGERFMLAAHRAAELAPRDVVSRAIHRRLRERGETQVWLDATGIEREAGAGTLARRFPKLSATTAAHGFDWTREPVPVAPAAHYTMGGIASDLDGRSTVPGLFVAGEAASTGVHGANRLASNSLLEGLVFGVRAARAAVAYGAATRLGGGRWSFSGSAMSSLFDRAEALTATRAPVASTVEGDADAEHELRLAVDEGLGIERDEAGLRRMSEFATRSTSSLAELVGMMAGAALARTESRGSHQRSDWAASDRAWQHRQAWWSRHSATTPAAVAQHSRDTESRASAC